MNTKIALVLTVLGIMTLPLLTTKPLTNQVFGLPPPCSSQLVLRAENFGHGPLGRTPVSIGTYLVCSPNGHPVSGATVNISVSGGTGISISKSVTTNSGGMGSTPILNLGPSSNPYEAKGYYAGDSNHSPATQEWQFFVGK